MNILIGKLGRSIYFDPKNWSFANGDEEASLLYTHLARTYPQHTFYLVGKSDLTRTRKKHAAAPKSTLSSFFGEDEEEEGFFDNLPENIIDLMEGFKEAKDRTGINEVDYIEERIKGMSFDAGIIFQGPSPNVGICNRGVLTLGDNGTVREAKSLEMFQSYYAPIMHTLNITNTPYFLLVSDPRYVPLLQRDCFNDEKFILSQVNVDKTVKRIEGYYEKSAKEFLREVKCKYRYARIETIFFMMEKKVDFRNIEKNNLFIMGINDAGIASDREKIIKEWLLDHTDTHPVKIYGKWRQEFIDAYPGVFEEKSIKSVEPEFWATKYTMIPPFKENMTNFVTQKFWKMIYYGIVPFFHPAYDTDKLFDVPDILRVKSAKEMWERIDYLEANPEEYKKLLDHLYGMLKDEYFTGEFITNIITNSVNKISEQKM